MLFYILDSRKEFDYLGFYCGIDIEWPPSTDTHFYCKDISLEDGKTMKLFANIEELHKFMIASLRVVIR